MVRIIHSRILGGWFIVRGPHQTPISGRYYLVSRAAAPADADAPSDPDLELARSVDPELAAAEPDAAASAGRYLRSSLARGVSTVWTSGGREYYRNRRGLCEDAPCCGCCNA